MLKPDELTLLFFGKTGVGKSSTLNSLFGLTWSTDNAVACTKEPQIAYLDRSHYAGYPYEQVRVVDMPGMGESLTDDETYIPYYEEWIPQTHSLVWGTQADTRAYKRDEIFLTKLLALFQPSLFLAVAIIGHNGTAHRHPTRKAGSAGKFPTASRPACMWDTGTNSPSP